MDILNLNIDIPRHVCISKKATQTLVSAVQNQACNDVVIAYTGTRTLEHADKIRTLLEDEKGERALNLTTFLLKGPSLGEVDRLEAHCSQFTEMPLIIAVGGGSCIDVVKLVAKRRKLRMYIYPTVLSSDCLVSPISVLNDGSKKVRIPGSVPNGIFIDVSITAQAPKDLILSGIADLMSNVSALLDINYCEEQRERQSFAILLSKASFNHITSMTDIDIDRPRFQAALAQGLILSGLSMNLAGSSITASGAEHLISHAIDYDNVGNCSHGKQVYIGMLASNLLRLHFGEESISKRTLRVMKSFGLPQYIDKYKVSPEQLVNAIIKAPTFRPERKTILDKVGTLSPEEIFDIVKVLYKKSDKVTT